MYFNHIHPHSSSANKLLPNWLPFPFSCLPLWVSLGLVVWLHYCRKNVSPSINHYMNIKPQAEISPMRPSPSHARIAAGSILFRFVPWIQECSIHVTPRSHHVNMFLIAARPQIPPDGMFFPSLLLLCSLNPGGGDTDFPLARNPVYFQYTDHSWVFNHCWLCKRSFTDQGWR